jgi:hypothetical protein
MRTFLTLALVFAAFGANAAYAGDKAVNTVCPKSGKPVDPEITVSVKDKDGKAVTVGTCCKNCAAKVEADPAKYVAAAEKNKKAE